MTVLLTAVAGGGSVVSAVPAVASAPVAEHLLDPGLVGDSPETEALAAADRLGRPVEVAGSKTQSSRVLATPQGSLLLESYPVPRWIDKHDGSGWRQVDTTLESTQSGVVAPIATFADSRFSPGLPPVRLTPDL
ncbi:hypothetical protein [Micromonospora sp. L31]|uniref:hypothetical protein n=1 Tax=Micromonospora sp. L31 TaxID=3452213 RepID=UPI003F8BEE31